MNRGSFSALRFLSISLIVLAMLLVTLELVRYSRLRANFPPGLIVAGVPVGGLDRAAANQRLLEVYSQPVVLRYNDSPIHLDPAVVDFRLDAESMLAAADLLRTEQPFWQGFWEHLWGRSGRQAQVPLRFSYSEQRLRTYLREIAERYDSQPVAAQPIVGTVSFTPGQAGLSLDEDTAVLLVEGALRSISNREVELPLDRLAPGRPAFQNLQVLLRQIIQVSGFDGLAGIYLQDLQTRQELHFAVQNDEPVAVQPDIAFTASSIIKVPIMVSAFRHMSDANDLETLDLLNKMITKSGNEDADWLMDRVIDERRGPLLVTEDMQALGLENTYLAGYFSLGSPLLATIETPANSRTDVDTDPDPYSQTTPADMGMLLSDLYQCSQTGGSALAAVFPGEIDAAKCQLMINYLIQNKLPVLLTGGLPDGTQIAHKHGWVSTNGIINTIGDAGIIYSPGGNYVMVVFLHHPQQLVWDPASKLVSDLSRAVYNYYNLPERIVQ